MEWSNPYNPFNSMKALVHAQHFQGIIKNEILPPIVVNMDLTNKCNYKCGFCMFGGQRERASCQSKNFRSGNNQLPLGYALGLPKLWKSWGVKASCLAGGGEPTLHPDCLPLIEEYGKNKIDLGFVTNGYLVNNQEWWDKVNKNAKFVGFSMDAGNKTDYAKVKGVSESHFQKVISNLQGLSETRKNNQTKLQIGYKFLLDRDNWTGIYDAAKIAKEVGANHFQFRPAIDPDTEYFADKRDQIWEQIAQAQKDLENDSFKVMGVRHKFNPDLTKKHNFKTCRANMLTTTWAADGWVYMCTDSRGEEWSKLVRHLPDPRKVIDFWGSPEHLSKVQKIDFHKNCDRCTLSPYNEMFEQVFIEDKMDKNLI